MGIISSDYEHNVAQLNRCEKVVRDKAYSQEKYSEKKTVVFLQLNIC